ncbi:hypothetical protein ACVOMV_01505 [Mesorhizobium atlanticum]
MRRDQQELVEQGVNDRARRRHDVLRHVEEAQRQLDAADDDHRHGEDRSHFGAGLDAGSAGEGGQVG